MILMCLIYHGIMKGDWMQKEVANVDETQLNITLLHLLRVTKRLDSKSVLSSYSDIIQ